MIIGIYKIISPNNRVYIGQSTNIIKRFKTYKQFTKHVKGQVKLFRSFEKYNVENHKFEILEECAIDELNNRERYWQDYYDVLNNGLNCKLTNTIDKSGVHSQEIREKIRLSKIGDKNSFYGKKHTEDWKLERSIKTKGINHPCYGKKYSQERINKMSQITKDLYKNGFINANSKVVLDYSTGIYYDSIKQAAEAINIPRERLNSYLRGKAKNKTNIQYA